MTRITVPFLDANIVDVTVVKWHKAVGEQVATGEVIAEISTDKAAYEIESPASGTLITVLAPEKSIVPVKYILGLIGENGETDDEAATVNAKLVADYRAAATASAPAAAPSASAAAPAAPAAPATGGTALRATPKARRFAQANGIDLAEVQKATGAAMITEAIIQQYLGSVQ